MVLLQLIGQRIGYTLRFLKGYHRYYRYLDDNFSNSERLRFTGLRQLLLLQVASLGLGLVFTGFNEALSLSYQSAWYFYAVQGYLIYSLIVVGSQANYAAASSPRQLAGTQPPPLPVAGRLTASAYRATPASEPAAALHTGGATPVPAAAGLPTELLA